MAFVHRLFFGLAYPLRSIYLVFFTQNNLSAQHKLFTPFYVLIQHQCNCKDYSCNVMINGAIISDFLTPK